MLVRTWNLFHGNTVPPGRRAFLRAMVELITAGRPDAVCLQEVPAWALGSVGAWARMQAVTARTMRPRLGPLPIPAAAGRALTAPYHGLIRSAFAGQGNAILFPAEAKVLATRVTTINTNVFCEDRGARLGLSPREMRRWERERRVCHLVQYELPNRRRYVVANFHATSMRDPRIADAEVGRALSFVEQSFEIDQPMVLAGDFNLEAGQSKTIQAHLSAPVESRWTAYGPGIDQVLLRSATVTRARVWPDAEREHGGRLLSDHAPVEVELELEPRR